MHDVCFSTEEGEVAGPMLNQSGDPSPMEVDDDRQLQGHASHNPEGAQNRQCKLLCLSCWLFQSYLI